ncbi:helix-hairpin-helix domain-containing protein [Rubeoparvulum massiliense]|uniref:helix-hairpin-helix domain-containing protein n=1 Tax=Rubeoparvulum massiliense TaxID=1631346 RepID=UPI00069FD2D0|nr:helix-hairpin-helix domain-containing protein [Rubeoparvulum massiliense]
MWETWSLRERIIAIITFILMVSMGVILVAQYSKINHLEEDLFVLQSMEQIAAERFVSEEVITSEEEKPPERVAPILYIIDVKGAVKRPGVYTVTQDGRVMDAITTAGGLLDEATTRHVNLAAPLQDGMVIYIPFHGEEGVDSVLLWNQAGQSSLTGESKELININTASKEELMRLPGIGESKAQTIIQYREEHGRFQSVDDLLQVSGIGAKTLAKFRDQITAQ